MHHVKNDDQRIGDDLSPDKAPVTIRLNGCYLKMAPCVCFGTRKVHPKILGTLSIQYLKKETSNAAPSPSRRNGFHRKRAPW